MSAVPSHGSDFVSLYHKFPIQPKIANLPHQLRVRIPHSTNTESKHPR